MVDTKILSSLLGYKGNAKVTTPNFEVEVKGGEKIVGGGSQYSPGGITGQGTLSVTVAKALEELNNGSAIAYYNGNRSVAERIFTDDDGNVTAREFACYTTTGTVVAGRLENGVINQIQVGYGKRFGTVIMEALFPVLVVTDSEFDNNLDNIFHLIIEDDFKVILAALSDNVYYRLKDGKFKLNAKEKGGSWNVSLIQQGSIEAGLYSITTEETKIIGSLNDSYLAQFANGAKPVSSKKGLTVKELAGKYANKNRQLTDTERNMVRKVPNYVEIPGYIPTVCEIIEQTKETNRPVQNVLFIGPAGTGKTQNSELIASAFDLPLVIQVGSASMEIIDLTGMFIPKISKGIETGIDSLPTIEDIDFDLEGSYKRLTGKKSMPKGVTFEEVVNILFEKQQEIINKFGGSSEGGSDFLFVPSPLIQAIKHGWVVECQEFNMILNSGVLTGLNSILEGGTIQLPTGEVVERHPDSIVIFTMNTNYEGCRPLNQSVLDRFPIKIEVPLPDDKEIVKRLKKVCKCKDTAFLTNQLDCYKSIVEYLAGQGYNGVLGMRALYDWTLISITLGDMLQAAEFTILESAMPSLLEDAERAELKDFIRNNILAPNVMNVNVA